MPRAAPRAMRRSPVSRRCTGRSIAWTTSGSTRISGRRSGSASPPTRRLGRQRFAALLGLTAALVAWRLAQLLLDWPAPVVNSIVPFALVVVVLWRLTGDPFAIRSSSHLRQQEGVS